MIHGQAWDHGQVGLVRGHGQQLDRTQEDLEDLGVVHLGVIGVPGVLPGLGQTAHGHRGGMIIMDAQRGHGVVGLV
jgi:hypothetical protein